MIKRLFDISLSSLALLLLSPVFLLLWVIFQVKEGGRLFYRQTRIGKNGLPFSLYKFRTMRPDSDKLGLLTVGGRDPRVTATGHFLRKYKLDELPQLLNILKGEMSFVGPRPEVKKYVDLYTEEQRIVLSVKPGLTDYASLAYINENEILGTAKDPEKTYIEEIMPAKIALNQQYIREAGIFTDVKILLKTVSGIVP